MSEIEWIDAPPRRERRSGRGHVQAFVRELKARPGEWAIYPHPVKGASQSAASGNNNRRFPGTEWTSRNVGKPDFALYARWVGENGEYA